MSGLLEEGKRESQKERHRHWGTFGVTRRPHPPLPPLGGPPAIATQTLSLSFSVCRKLHTTPNTRGVRWAAEVPTLSAEPGCPAGDRGPFLRDVKAVARSWRCSDLAGRVRWALWNLGGAAASRAGTREFVAWGGSMVRLSGRRLSRTLRCSHGMLPALCLASWATPVCRLPPPRRPLILHDPQLPHTLPGTQQVLGDASS